MLSKFHFDTPVGQIGTKALMVNPDELAEKMVVHDVGLAVEQTAEREADAEWAKKLGPVWEARDKARAERKAREEEKEIQEQLEHWKKDPEIERADMLE